MFSSHEESCKIARVKLSSERKATFLAELARHGIVARAARAASPHSVRGCVMSFRDECGRDAEFAADWAEAMEQACGQVESELHRRAVLGYEEPVYQRGEKVGTVRKYSDRLLELRIKSLIPAYRNHSKVEIDQKVEHAKAASAALEADLRKLTPEGRDALREFIETESFYVKPGLLPGSNMTPAR